MRPTYCGLPSTKGIMMTPGFGIRGQAIGGPTGGVPGGSGARPASMISLVSTTVVFGRTKSLVPDGRMPMGRSMAPLNRPFTVWLTAALAEATLFAAALTPVLTFVATVWAAEATAFAADLTAVAALPTTV